MFIYYNIELEKSLNSISAKAQMEAHENGVCCKKILIQTAMTYGGSYKIEVDKGSGRKID